MFKGLQVARHIPQSPPLDRGEAEIGG